MTGFSFVMFKNEVCETDGVLTHFWKQHNTGSKKINGKHLNFWTKYYRLIIYSCKQKEGTFSCMYVCICFSLVSLIYKEGD